jgi:hypothetical protein
MVRSQRAGQEQRGRRQLRASVRISSF